VTDTVKGKPPLCRPCDGKDNKDVMANVASLRRAFGPDEPAQRAIFVRRLVLFVVMTDKV
jgi:hypothetical protein